VLPPRVSAGSPGVRPRSRAGLHEFAIDPARCGIGERSPTEITVNVDVRVLFQDGERSARAGELATARACFLEAGEAAALLQLWRTAIRCYRHALELDLTDREPLDRIARMPLRVISGRGWDEYRTVLDRHPAWPRFGCRAARVVVGNQGAIVECPIAGPVIDLIMSERDLIEARPEPAWRALPIAMAMIILRRALWPSPRDRPREPLALRVVYAGRERARLDELGEWEPIVGA
jgi:hypothetical protein